MNLECCILASISYKNQGYINMRKDYRLVIATTLSLMSPLTFAGEGLYRTPYVGVEIIQTNQEFKNSYGKNVFKKNPQDYNIFAGFKFSKYFGSEIGYEFQPSRSKNATLTGGDSFVGGDTIDAGDTLITSSKVKGYHPYLGLFGEVCQSWSLGTVKFQALIAASFSEIKASISTNTASGALLDISNYSKSRIVPMVKLSATNNFTQHLGLRLSLNYRNLSQFKILSQNQINEIRLKDTYGVGLGLVYSF